MKITAASESHLQLQQKLQLRPVLANEKAGLSVGDHVTRQRPTKVETKNNVYLQILVFGHFWLYNHASLRQQFVSRPKNSVTTWDEGSKLSVREKQNRQGQQFETVVVMKLRTAFEKSGVQTRRITVISGNENKLILSFGGHNIKQQKNQKTDQSLIFRNWWS